MDRFRLDKWLWAARLFKTRGLAAEEISRGRILVNGQVAKAARELREGDQIELRRGGVAMTVVVRALSRLRGPASLAQTYYEEMAESVEHRLAALARKKEHPEPALDIEGGRPTKRDRRQLAVWDRWSASADTDPER